LQSADGAIVGRRLQSADGAIVGISYAPWMR
jgi:hypothetical protein